jgi:hypothetical protein
MRGRTASSRRLGTVPNGGGGLLSLHCRHGGCHLVPKRLHPLNIGSKGGVSEALHDGVFYLSIGFISPGPSHLQQTVCLAGPLSQRGACGTWGQGTRPRCLLVAGCCRDASLLLACRCCRGGLGSMAQRCKALLEAAALQIVKELEGKHSAALYRRVPGSGDSGRRNAPQVSDSWTAAAGLLTAYRPGEGHAGACTQLLRGTAAALPRMPCRASLEFKAYSTLAPWHPRTLAPSHPRTLAPWA